MVVETPHLFKRGKCTGLLLSFVTIPGGGGGETPHLFKRGKCTGLLLSFVTIPGGGGGNPTPI